MRDSVTLAKFLQDYCEYSVSIKSKADRIHQRVKEGKLPFFPNPHKPKGHKKYYADELIAVWHKVKEVTDVPCLKKQKKGI